MGEPISATDHLLSSLDSCCSSSVAFSTVLWASTVAMVCCKHMLVSTLVARGDACHSVQGTGLPDLVSFAAILVPLLSCDVVCKKKKAVR